MDAHAEAILEAIAMVLAADGEVSEQEFELAVGATRDLPGLVPLEGEIESALGAAFERFVDEGTEASTATIAAATADQDARLEILLAAAAAARADGAFTEGELACIRALGRAVGAPEVEIERVLAL